MLKLKDDLGRQRPRQGLKGPKGHRQCNQCTYTHNTLTHTHTTQAGPKTKSSWRDEARPGQVFEAPTVAAAAASSHTKKRAQSSEEEEEEEAKQRREEEKKLASFIIILYLFFFCSFSNTQAVEKSVFLYSVCARRGRQSSAALETCFIALSLSLPPSHSFLLFHSAALCVLIHCTNKSQLWIWSQCVCVCAGFLPFLLRFLSDCQISLSAFAFAVLFDFQRVRERESEETQPLNR